jgi:hypothetical protein
MFEVMLSIYYLSTSQAVWYLGIKGWILNAAVQENPNMVLHHERLNICILVLFVDLLHQSPVHQSQSRACPVPNSSKITVAKFHWRFLKLP